MLSFRRILHHIYSHYRATFSHGALFPKAVCRARRYIVGCPRRALVRLSPATAMIFASDCCRRCDRQRLDAPAIFFSIFRSLAQAATPAPEPPPMLANDFCYADTMRNTGLRAASEAPRPSFGDDILSAASYYASSAATAALATPDAGREWLRFALRVEA